LYKPEKYLITGGGKIKCHRCQARSSRTKLQCGRPSLKISRAQKCKWHGGLSTGPRTQEGIKRIQNAHWKHGNDSKEARADRSEKSLMFFMLEELGHHVNLFPANSTCTRGRKPNGYQKLDLNDPDQLAKAIKLSMAHIKQK
jgi:hypothetical protein